jgi:uncharacterized protein (DUF1800 family)
MIDRTSASSEVDYWAPYVPAREMPWNLRRVVHLHRRAGFAATWDELQHDLKDGPKASIDRLLAGKARADGQPKDFQATAALLAERAIADAGASRLKVWWLYRMVFGPDPLTERLALVWHNHFATSNEKVRSLSKMHRQNELFRVHARARFARLLNAVVRDPALLIWLDAAANRKGHPNENLARELMELFTLGIGHYSEQDVKEAGRALTGWTLSGEKVGRGGQLRPDGDFREDGTRHDDGEKTILGRKGRLKGADLVGLLLEQPATARRLAGRLREQFFGEGDVSAGAVATLAAGLREHDLDVGWGVATVLRSRAFFAEANLGRRVQGPVEYVVGAVRSLERFEPAPSTLVLADWCARLGQDLFYPPNVGGWKGGRGWISPQSMIGRANYAAALVNGTLTLPPQPFDALALAKRHGRGGDLGELIAFYGDLLLTGSRPDDRIADALGARTALTPQTARRAVILILASPEAQLA